MLDTNSAAEQTPAQPAASYAGRTRAMLRVWLRDLMISLGIAAFIIIFLYQPVKVEGTSMLPALSDQERIFINKFVYRLEPISRGDVIVFHYPLDPSKSYIKRVIAVGGDTVRIDNGAVYVNGRRVDETYVPNRFRDSRSYPETTIPAGSYFVVGDHRSLSNDSRDFGPVADRYVSGKAVFAYWPFDKAGVLR
jgi:signal peptidase I